MDNETITIKLGRQNGNTTFKEDGSTSFSYLIAAKAHNYGDARIVTVREVIEGIDKKPERKINVLGMFGKDNYSISKEKVTVPNISIDLGTGLKEFIKGEIRKKYNTDVDEEVVFIGKNGK